MAESILVGERGDDMKGVHRNLDNTGHYIRMFISYLCSLVRKKILEGAVTLEPFRLVGFRLM